MFSIGQRRPVSPNRRLIIDLLHFSRRIPLCPCERSCDLAELAEARRLADQRISWSVLFLKAYAITARDFAELRRFFYAWPWASEYEHPESVGTLAVEREHLGEKRLCFARFPAPDRASLAELQERLDRYRTEPVEIAFKRELRLAACPLPIRRLLWWANLIGPGAARAKRLGTFGLSPLAAQGAWNRFHPTLTTSSLSYGPLDRAGRSLVTMIYDHRVLDGAPAARALARLEEVLQTQITAELRALRTAAKAA